MARVFQSTAIRWKLLLSLVIVIACLWVGIRSFPEIEIRGAGGAVDLLFSLLSFVVLLVWFCVLSPFSWKQRMGGGIGLLLLPLVLLKFDGHQGSFFPQLSWRWGKSSATEMPLLVGDFPAENVVISTQGDENFSRFLGESMSNWVSGSLLPSRWFLNRPRERWRMQIGEGWSSFAIAGEFAYTMEQRGPKELTVCYELLSGEAVWFHEEEVRFEESMGDDGPRSTPTVVEERVYSFGATGILNCLDARSGQKIWGRKLLDEMNHAVPKWAKSTSPLVVDGKVVVTLGREAEGNLIALDAHSGEVLWRSGNYSASYASPVVGSLAGVRQIIALQSSSVDGYSIDTGQILWSFPIRNPQSNCASPLIVDDTVITSAGYGYGTHRIQITKGADGFEAKQLWHSKKLKAKFADLVINNGFLFGLNDGRLTCLNLRDGSLAWRGSNVGHGQLLGVGDHLIIQEEQGQIRVIEANPNEEVQTTSFHALDHRTWNHPSLAGRYLLVRNDREAVLFEYQ